jgi:ATP-dependent DNA ligase
MIGFDVLTLDGQDLRREPVEFRRDALAWMIGAGGPGLIMSESVVGDGAPDIPAGLRAWV